MTKQNSVPLRYQTWQVFWSLKGGEREKKKRVYEHHSSVLRTLKHFQWKSLSHFQNNSKHKGGGWISYANPLNPGFRSSLGSSGVKVWTVWLPFCQTMGFAVSALYTEVRSHGQSFIEETDGPPRAAADTATASSQLGVSPANSRHWINPPNVYTCGWLTKKFDWHIQYITPLTKGYLRDS